VTHSPTGSPVTSSPTTLSPTPLPSIATWRPTGLSDVSFVPTSDPTIFPTPEPTPAI